MLCCVRDAELAAVLCETFMTALCNRVRVEVVRGRQHLLTRLFNAHDHELTYVLALLEQCVVSQNKYWCFSTHYSSSICEAC